jgi:transcriptional regulator with XRE-family HTH domain
MNFNLFIGKRISELRRLKEISQEELAYKAKIDRTYMSSIERGKRSISLIVAIKIASALDTSILSLIEKPDGTYIGSKDITK